VREERVKHNYTKIEVKGLPVKYYKDKEEIPEAEYLEAINNPTGASVRR
jgi:hypothetical protein